MTTPYDVPPAPLIEALSAHLKERPSIQAPEWARYAKTGVHREKAPVNRDWWHTRVAAVLRKVYLDGPIGVERLRGEYGGSRDRGAAPDRAKKGSGSIIREALQQLEKEKLLENVKGVGRRVTPTGRALVDKAAYEAKQKLLPEIPALSKY
ncbi:MAG TPA: 30S ribosomal protein S19e [Candidatus Thermoplasmatota archaeon]|jgi:small subunit ribosomal protein S19e|nr:30S ribosomal protein S19e [Candidatus Thermoplasmatota archaeon]